MAKVWFQGKVIDAPPPHPGQAPSGPSTPPPAIPVPVSQFWAPVPTRVEQDVAAIKEVLGVR